VLKDVDFVVVKLVNGDDGWCGLGVRMQDGLSELTGEVAVVRDRRMIGSSA
jgi:hypothetical protein